MFWLPRLTTFLFRRRLFQEASEPAVCAASPVLASLDAREVLEGFFYGLLFLSRTCLFRASCLVCLLLSSETNMSYAWCLEGKMNSLSIWDMQYFFSVHLLAFMRGIWIVARMQSLCCFSSWSLVITSKNSLKWQLRIIFWKWNAADNLRWFCI